MDYVCVFDSLALTGYIIWKSVDDAVSYVCCLYSFSWEWECSISINQQSKGGHVIWKVFHFYKPLSAKMGKWLRYMLYGYGIYVMKITAGESKSVYLTYVKNILWLMLYYYYYTFDRRKDIEPKPFYIYLLHTGFHCWLTWVYKEGFIRLFLSFPRQIV